MVTSKATGFCSAVGQILETNAGARTLFARYGGDEFVILMPRPVWNMPGNWPASFAAGYPRPCAARKHQRQLRIACYPLHGSSPQDSSSGRRLDDLRSIRRERRLNSDHFDPNEAKKWKRDVSRRTSA